MAGDMRVRQGGTGERVLLLVHGLGATADVWSGWSSALARHWPGRWLAPDLPGHGGSTPLAEYSFESLAASMATLLRPDDRVTVLGHSLGGVVGLTLAGPGHHAVVDRVIGLGIKVAWAEDELAKAKALAARPVAWFATRAEAAERYLRVSGLAGLLDPADDAVSAGLCERDGQWRLAMDPASFGVGAPDMPGLLGRCRAAVLLARGELDPMVSDDQLARLGAPTRTVARLGHNAHVQDPDAVIGLLDPH